MIVKCGSRNRTLFAAMPCSAELIHHYTFDTDVSDSEGGTTGDGTLSGRMVADLVRRSASPLARHAEVMSQTVAGYGTYGRSAYGGVRVKW